MNVKRVVLLLSPLFAAAVALAGNEGGVVKPANVNVIALPAVQKPITDVPPPAIKPVTTVQPKILSPVQPGKLQPKIPETGPQPTAKVLPPMDSIAIDRKQPPPVGDRVGAIKQGGSDSGPLVSPLDDSRKPVTPKKGVEGVSESDLDKARQKYQEARDSLDEVGADKSKRLQEYQNAKAAYYKVLSNMSKKSSDTSAGIISNMK